MNHLPGDAIFLEFRIGVIDDIHGHIIEVEHFTVVAMFFEGRLYNVVLRQVFKTKKFFLQ